jgi:hypothetical protein
VTGWLPEHTGALRADARDVDETDDAPAEADAATEPDSGAG